MFTNSPGLIPRLSTSLLARSDILSSGSPEPASIRERAASYSVSGSILTFCIGGSRHSLHDHIAVKVYVLLDVPGQMMYHTGLIICFILSIKLSIGMYGSSRLDPLSRCI